MITELQASRSTGDALRCFNTFHRRCILNHTFNLLPRKDSRRPVIMVVQAESANESRDDKRNIAATDSHKLFDIARVKLTVNCDEWQLYIQICEHKLYIQTEISKHLMQYAYCIRNLYP
jgi:hypothetical protein